MKNSFYIFIFSIIIGFVVSGLLFRKCCRTPEIIKTDTITKTDTMWCDTTITDTVFEPKYIIKKKVDTLYKENGDTVHLVTEQKVYEKSILSAKDTADLKIYVSGINTALDSLKIRLKTHTVTNTVEITKYVEEKKTIWNRFSLGVGIGYGIGLKNKDLEPFVGVSIVYNLEF